MEGDRNDAGMHGWGEKEGRDTGKQARRNKDQREKKACPFSRQPPGKELPKRQKATLRPVDSKNPSA